MSGAASTFKFCTPHARHQTQRRTGDQDSAASENFVKFCVAANAQGFFLLAIVH